jgi:hypothetical protein
MNRWPLKRVKAWLGRINKLTITGGSKNRSQSRRWKLKEGL